MEDPDTVNIQIGVFVLVKFAVKKNIIYIDDDVYEI